MSNPSPTPEDRELRGHRTRGERERWVSVTGHTTVALDAAHDLAARLAERYWDLDDPRRAADLTEILAQDWVRLVIHPEKVRRYAT